VAIQQQFKTKKIYTRLLPTIQQINSFSDYSQVQSVVIYDRILLKNSSFKKWLDQFEFKIPVVAGEKLKTLDQFSNMLLRLQKWQGRLQGSFQFVAIGGGSVGDFAGFLASTYQRGRPLILIPSTWLSVIDSAHGGKNGLNLKGVKNQVGTIYPAAGIIVCKQLLDLQPQDRVFDAFGEVIKIILIDKPQYLKKVKMSGDYIWLNLKYFIQAKMNIVCQDPFEKKGLRHVLNLGHTMGHVYESEMNLPHGLAISLGLVFTARWSYELKLISQKTVIAVLQSILLNPQVEAQFKKSFKLSEKNILLKLNQDKKRSKKNSKIRFVFLSDTKKTIILEKSACEIIEEYRRQRFLMI